MAGYLPIEINYNPQTTYAGTTFANYIGAQSVVGQRGTLPTFTNSNSIFVSKSGNDGNAGTMASPKLTLNACFATLPANFTYVVILDSGTYNETFTCNFTTTQLPNFVGIYAADGQTPVFEVVKGAIPGTYGAGNAARVVQGAATPNYYISKSGNDATGARNNAALPFLTVQGALSDPSRINGDILEIQDNGVYVENITWGNSNTGTLRAKAGKVPTLQAVYGVTNIPTSDTCYVPGSGPYQVTVPIPGLGTFAANVSVVSVFGGSPWTQVYTTPTFTNTYQLLSPGVYLFYSGNANAQIIISYTYTQPSALISWGFNNPVYIDGLVLDSAGTNQYLHAGYDGTAATLYSCSIINFNTLGYGSNGSYNNCLIRNVQNYSYGVPYTPGVSFYNCYSISAAPNGSRVNVNVGNALGNMLQSTFVNQNVSGNANTYTQITIDRCFFNNSTFAIIDNGVLANTSYLFTNSLIYNGGFGCVREGSATANQTTLTMTNVVIYALGYVAGVTLYSQGAYGQIDYVVSHLNSVTVIGSQTNYVYTGFTGTLSTLTNCASMNATTAALTVASASAGRLTVSGFLDSGSASTWSGVTPIASEAGANVISTTIGQENVTLSANDSGMFYGPVNSIGALTNPGPDFAIFTIVTPCVLNGLTFSTWTPPIATLCSPYNQEAGVQGAPTVPLNISYCTFTNAGPYSIKAASSSVLTNNLFSSVGGHAIMASQNGITVENNVAYSAAGAFLANFGQGALVKHNTAYACQYGEYDSTEVVSVTSDSNIFSSSGTYDYSGPNTLTYSCVNTIDPNTAATLATTCTQMDPLFQSALTGNLTLQALAWGYFWNSPCIGQASDGLDIGAYNVTYGAASTTYTTINFGINDPTTGNPWRNPDAVDHEWQPINLGEGDTENGGAYSVASTYKLHHTLTWNPEANDMPQGQLAALVALYKCSSNQIQISWNGGAFVNAFLLRADGFEYTDLTQSYADAAVPQPLKSLVIREA